jgi:hypothetical protein
MRMYYVAFLGEKQEIQGKRESGRIIFHVPAVNRGGILWLAPAPSRPQP